MNAEDEVLIGLARTVVGISTRAAAELGGVSLVQLRALTVLAELPDAPLAHLARGVGGGVSTTSRLVDRLVVAGLVDRRPSTASRRSISLRLTPRGADLLDRYDRLRLAELRTGLAGLPEGRRDAVLGALADFAAAAGRTASPTPRDGGGHEEEGGESACFLHLVCPECGRVADEAPPTRCAGCGAELTGD
ncbi:DNA-binding transcriptional regulator, MarR family [Geodermatophilus dictyosporus]|uniref:DNA-binding transcriptional regulator, MarR family n=1 Tax=Geodermatophilus dictyosporus TaxID=1523247 RepID=A0A1I5MJN6_9ACTN|nr:MarR family winged helix-turn-helix transcriptional regulator [Geodermatophilus dictyosporus]SFP09814.1 DNA-binding transcriptional regulator, MarR family [Geodermatophilus dictyosporus]